MKNNKMTSSSSLLSSSSSSMTLTSSSSSSSSLSSSSSSSSESLNSPPETSLPSSSPTARSSLSTRSNTSRSKNSTIHNSRNKVYNSITTSLSLSSSSGGVPKRKKKQKGGNRNEDEEENEQHTGVQDHHHQEEEEEAPLLIVSSSLSSSSSSSSYQTKQESTQKMSKQQQEERSPSSPSIISCGLLQKAIPSSSITKYTRNILYFLAFFSCYLLFFYYSSSSATTSINNKEPRQYDMVIRPIMEHHADHLKKQTQQVHDMLDNVQVVDKENNNVDGSEEDIITSNTVYSTLVYPKEKEEEEEKEEENKAKEDLEERMEDAVQQLLTETLLQKEGKSIYDYNEMITSHQPWEDPYKSTTPASSSSSSSSSSSKDCQYIDVWSNTRLEEEQGGLHKLNQAKIIETSKRDPSQHWVDVPCTYLPQKLNPDDDTEEEEQDENKKWNDDVQDTAAVISIHLPSSFASASTVEDSPPLQETKRRQTIQGFGGSITEATSLNWRSLSLRAQSLVMQLFYNSKMGLGFTMGRIPINSCDFAVTNYNYDDVDGDFSMKEFDTSVQHDVANGIIEMIQRAQSVVREEGMYAGGVSAGERLKIVASPFSPPPWMKRPVPGIDKSSASHAGGMDGTATPSCLKDGTGPDSKYAMSWANYLGEFLSAYRNHGIDIWAVTVQNEPVNDEALWEGCAFNPVLEEEFIVHHLGPVLREYFPDVKILVYDSNREDVVSWMNYLWRDRSLDAQTEENTVGTKAVQYMDGVAMHWYSTKKPSWLLDGALGAPNMHRVVEMAYYYQRRKEANAKKKQRQLQLEREEKWVRARTNNNLRHSSSTTATQDLEASTSNGKTGNMNNDDNILQRLPILLDTEATHCFSTGYAIGDIDVSWYRAERNAHAMLSQLAAGSNGWIEWNMLLDPIGGPNHVENFCDAPIVAVPHRAQSAVEFQLMPDFEHYQLKEGEVIMGEYETKFTLGSKMGYPPSYIDAGIIVQPMFYYTGHLSKFIRPGSTPLMALVGESPGGSASRTFRPAGQTTPGGGNNDNARPGMEVTVWPCEGSTRQSWTIGGNGQLQTYRLDGYGEKQCVTLKDSVDATLGGLVLTDCSAADAASFSVVTQSKRDPEEGDVVKFMTMKRRANECLGILPLANGGGAYGPKGGAQAILLPCDHESALWNYYPKTGEVESEYFSWDGPEKNSGVCLTTGWPFLQAGAFDTSGTSADGEIVVVVLNESSDDARFIISTPRKGQQQPPSTMLKSLIPAHSIQTILF